MVKKGALKFIHSAVDPEQLFDLADDPHETVNQAGNPHYAAARDQLRQLLQERWDIESLNREIVLSQCRRLFLRDALAQGRFADWDFAAADELESHCLRADRVYSKWAYEGMLGYRFPEDAE